jgi:LDH2 family malate/lactate/ureidoglycolate dehydrogenase
VDGDGGLGYFPVYEGTQAIIEKAKSHGIAVMATRNHGHIGAAGIYARMTLDHDLVSFVTSGHQLLFEAAEPLYRAAGGSPMTFSAPAGRQHPLVLDFGTMHDLYASDAHRDEIARLAPRLVLRFIGLGEVCQAWGGLLTGLTMDGDAPGRIFAGANQGAIVMAFRIDLFVEPDEFKRQMDAYVRRVQQLRPLPGYDRAYLAGGVEAARRREYLETGVPITQDHRQALEQLASTLGIVVPWK